MASETVDPFDWSHPPPSWTVPPERLVHSINQCNLSAGTERVTTACEATTLPVWSGYKTSVKYCGKVKIIKSIEFNIKYIYERFCGM